MPKNHVFAPSKFLTMEEVDEPSESPSRVDGVQQYSFSLCHQSNGIALEFSDSAVSPGRIIGVEDDVCLSISLAQIEALCELVRKSGDFEVEECSPGSSLSTGIPRTRI